jgi:hypothetical protein
MASAMPLKPATQAALAAESRRFRTSSLATEDLIGQLLIKARAQRKSHDRPVSLSPANRNRKMTKVVTCCARSKAGRKLRRTRTLRKKVQIARPP